jgi:hypothetical protein
MTPEALAEQLNITVEQVLFVRRVAIASWIGEDDYPMLASLKNARIPCPPCLSQADLQALSYQIFVAKAKLSVPEKVQEPAIAA